MALGARFLKVTPWSCTIWSVFLFPLHSNLFSSTYSLVKVDGVFARNNVCDGRTLSLAGGFLGL
jgi:hypothetical protein